MTLYTVLDGARILVVDDEPAIVTVLARRLESWGCQVLTASSGEEGLAMAEAEYPDLILLDILMPKMKGWEACARLRKNPKTRTIPVVFLTALGMPNHIWGGLTIGAEDYLIKPFRPEEMKERLAVVLWRHRAQAAPPD